MTESRRVEGRLRLAPAVRMSDDAIRAHVTDARLAECAFEEFAVRNRERSAAETVRTPAERVCAAIEVSTEDGDVTLDGSVPSLVHKRLAGVLAWWVPGTREVINALLDLHRSQADRGNRRQRAPRALGRAPGRPRTP